MEIAIKSKNKTAFIAMVLIVALVGFFIVAKNMTVIAAEQINVSAYITDKKGEVLKNGEYEVRFAIYTNDRSVIDKYPSNSDAGARVWEESQNVYIQDGVISAYLGSVNSLPKDLNFSSVDYFLGIRIAQDSEMVPRKKIGVSIYAMNALNALDASSLGGFKTGKKQGDIMQLGSGGKIDMDFLPTGKGSGKIVLGNDSRLHSQNSDIGTDAYNFNIGNETSLGGNIFDLTVSGAGQKPTLRFNGATSSWQFSNDGINFSDISSGGYSGILGSANGGTGIDTSALSGIPIISAGSWSVGLSISTALGGTGITTYTPGDMLYYSAGTTLTKLAVGINGQVLVVSGGVPTWSDAAPGAAHQLLSSAHADTTIGSVARGDLIVGQGISPTWTKLGLGGLGTVLMSDGTDIRWNTLSSSNVGLGNVENTALSTWAGSVNITTLGTITNGTWNGSTIGVTYGGTGTTTQFTPGSIVFAGTNGVYDQDNANFFWDSTNHYLKLGSVPYSLGIDTTDNNKFKIFQGDGIAGTNTFSIDTNGVTTIASLNMGTQEFQADSGIISWIDMPVTSSATNNTVESYTAQLDGNPMITVYGQSDGAGGIKNTGVGIGTESPASLFSVGSTSQFQINTLGQVVAGVWNGTAIGVQYGGTGTTTQFTQGSIVFAGASGAYSEDNANFFWDNTNKRLGIGTASPNAQLTLVKADSTGLTDLLVNPTAKTSGNLIDLQVNGASKFSVDNLGNVGIAKSSYVGSTASPNKNIWGSVTTNTLNVLSETYADFSTDYIIGTNTDMVLNPGANAFTSSIGSMSFISTNSGNIYNLSEVTGSDIFVDHNGTGTISLSNGVYAQVNNNSGGTITTAAPISAAIYNLSGTTTTNKLLESFLYNSGNAADVYGLKASINNAGGSITNNYGVYLANPQNTGTLTNNYALYIENQTSGTNNYAIYQQGLAQNVFEGSMKIGNLNGVVSANSGLLSAGNVSTQYGGTGINTSASTGIPTISAGTWSVTSSFGVTFGGTGTTTQFTPGSIVFAGTNGVYSQDNANFFWDDTNKRLGIGTASPSAKLDITGVNSTAVTGSELITSSTNRDLTGSAGNWTLGANWTYGGNLLSHAAGAGNASLANAYLGAVPVAGKIYRVTFSYNTSTAGAFNMSFGGTQGPTVGTGLDSATITQVVVAVNANVLTFIPDGAWVGTLDNISVMEITPTSATQIVRNSDSTIGVEMRAGGSNLNNTFFGKNSGMANTTGYSNTGQGLGALQANTIGYQNTAIGQQSLFSNFTGHDNSASGYQSLYSNFSGSYNVAQGNQSLYSNTIGNYNSAVGYNALYSNRLGGANVAMGYHALRSNTSASNNVGIGYQALYTNTLGSDNVGIGYQALFSNTNGIQNIAIGVSALGLNTTGGNNTAVGWKSFSSNTNGGNNVGVGLWSGRYSVSGSWNVVAGSYAFYANSSGSNNTALGGAAMQNGSSGNNNTAVGYSSLSTNYGSYNLALGNYALAGNATSGNLGSYNNALGHMSMYSNASGSYNNSIGYQALYMNTTGYKNVAMGFQSLFNTRPTSKYINAFANNGSGKVRVTSSNHGLVGTVTVQISGGTPYDGSWSATVIDANTFDLTAVSYTTNTPLGWWSIDSEGRFNTAIGDASGYTNITGSNNTFLGYGADATVGNLTNATAIGYNASVAASNSLILGGTGVDSVNVGIGTSSPLSKFSVAGNGNSSYQVNINGQGTTAATYGIMIQDSGTTQNFWISDDGAGYLRAASWTYGSDRRMKENIASYMGGIDIISSLKPVEFDYIGGQKNQLGFIAQDVQDVLPGLVKKLPNGMLGIQTDGIIPVMVNAIQQQQSQININGESISTLNLKTDQSVNTLAELQASVDSQLASIQNKFSNYDKQIADIDTAMATLQAQMDELKTRTDNDLLMAKVDLHEQDIAYLKMVLGFDRVINPGDVDILGKLKAEIVEGNKLVITVKDEESRTIGQATILKIQKDDDGNGIDDVTGSDGKSVRVESMALTQNSKIFVTSKIVTDQPLAVVDLKPGKSFVVMVKNIVPEDIAFDWFLIEEQ